MGGSGLVLKHSFWWHFLKRFERLVLIFLYLLCRCRWKWYVTKVWDLQVTSLLVACTAVVMELCDLKLALCLLLQQSSIDQQRTPRVVSVLEVVVSIDRSSQKDKHLARFLITEPHLLLVYFVFDLKSCDAL